MHWGCFPLSLAPALPGDEAAAGRWGPQPDVSVEDPVLGTQQMALPPHPGELGTQLLPVVTSLGTQPPGHPLQGMPGPAAAAETSGVLPPPQSAGCPVLPPAPSGGGRAAGKEATSSSSCSMLRACPLIGVFVTLFHVFFFFKCCVKPSLGTHPCAHRDQRHRSGWRCARGQGGWLRELGSI